MKKAAISVVMPILIMLSGGLESISAQESGKIELTVIAQKQIEVTGENGEKILQLVPADKVVPGDEVIYTITYTNNGDEPAENLAVTNPIPEHMRYVGGSASGEGGVITYSVDNGKEYGLPENLKVKDADGKEVQARPEHYTHIKWAMSEPVAPQASGSVTFRAKLE